MNGVKAECTKMFIEIKLKLYQSTISNTSNVMREVLVLVEVLYQVLLQAAFF